jgi:hypothetical protein
LAIDVDVDANMLVSPPGEGVVLIQAQLVTLVQLRRHNRDRNVVMILLMLVLAEDLAGGGRREEGA